MNVSTSGSVKIGYTDSKDENSISDVALAMSFGRQLSYPVKSENHELNMDRHANIDANNVLKANEAGNSDVKQEKWIRTL